MEKKQKTTKTMPPSVVQRLTRYLTQVQNRIKQGKEWISSSELAAELGLTSSTVRQDLSYLDFSGISKKGYEVAKLQKVLMGVLGADKEWKTVVIGAGNLGRAIALHGELARRGFVIAAILDTDERKVGKKAGPLKVQHLRDVSRIVKKDKIDIGIIAVPAVAAQEVADKLVGAGVKGLLNLSLTHISVPAGVSLIDARMVASLLELTHSIMSK
jgi:redox-sensing transcriptional repressor